MRWMGHRLHAELYIAVEPHLTTIQSHYIAENLRHDLFHQFPNLAEVIVHVDPWAEQLETVHHLTLHHEPIPRAIN
jgi:divalent metal cation (Fe/Co/Zn/Cd) transporter